MSKVDAFSALLELIGCREAEAYPGGTFTKLVSLLFIGISLSTIGVSICPTPFLNSTPSSLDLGGDPFPQTVTADPTPQGLIKHGPEPAHSHCNPRGRGSPEIFGHR